ncbi:MAG: response regulator, partial [Byssovorax sp.]
PLELTEGRPAASEEEVVNHGTGDTDPLIPGDQVLLIVDADAERARLLGDVARKQGFKGVTVARGGAAAAMARELGAVAIALDVHLPDIDGWQVLDRLKQDLTTRHIPVEVFAAAPERARALDMGARGLIPVPVKTRQPLDEAMARMRQFVSTPTRRLLLVDPEETERAILINLLEGEDVVIRTASTAAEAIAVLQEEVPDLLLLGATLSDMEPLDLLARIDREESLAGMPIVTRSLVDMPQSDEARLARLTQKRVIKRVGSAEELVSAATLLLHLELAKRAPAARGILQHLQQSGTVLANKKVLVVDDDIRNIFAITTILDEHDMKTVSAETGSAAIEVLDRTPDIDIVLMDIMMPEMDGYDTMRAIRRRETFRALPIIAVTAKAMKGDRAKCFEAGATDYVAKPVNPDQLLALLRVWLRP